jgi:O-antigen/teichoic acid export membrane protein
MSGANFLLGVLLARWLLPAEYGQFAVLYATFLFLAGFHNALIVEPMSVLGAARQPDSLPAYRGTLLLLHIGLTGALSTAIAIGAALMPDSGLQRGLWATAAATPTTLLFWLFRRAFYLEARASWAMAASIVYAISLLGLVLLLRPFGWLSASTGVLAMGGAGAIACLATWLPLRLSSPSAEQVLDVARMHFKYGRWMLTTDIFTLGSTQIQTFLSAALLGLESAGVLRAMQAFTLPVVQVTTAVGVLGLPVMSRTFAEQGQPGLQRKGFLLTIGLGAGAAASALILMLLAGPLEQLVYNGKFAEFSWLIGVLSLGPFFGAIAQAYSLMLRSLRRPRYYLIVGLVPSCAGLLAAVPLILYGGLSGAALSLVATSVAASATNYWLYRRWIAPVPSRQREDALAVQS